MTTTQTDSGQTDTGRPDRTRLLLAGNYIDGALSTGSSAGSYTHVNPATGRPQRELTLAGPADVEAAVGAASRAFREWKRRSPQDRRDLLQAVARLLREQVEDLAVINALEVGTPLPFGRWAVNDAAAWFDYYAGWTDKVTGDTIPVPQEAGLDFTLREPVGVVAKVLTWNTPIGGISMSVAAALAAGCTVVLKPAEQAPFAAVRFAQLCTEAGLPDGAVNVLVGDALAGDLLVRHPDIAKVSFTGGPATARKLQAAAADNVTPLVLELGGKSAHLVFADADLTSAVGFSTMITALSGQGCSLPSRLLVERPVYDQVVGMVVESLRQVRVGDPFDEANAMGPVVNGASAARIVELVAAAVESGAATCALGGHRLDGDLADGYFIPPTVLCDVDPDSSAAQDEIFGPVLCIVPFDTEDEAVRIANSTRYGLAAYVHTSDLGRALRLSRDLDAGGVGINGHILPATCAAPFGGIGLSGYGREGGREGIEEFLHVKNIAIKY